ncbi:hypothetical protein CFOL_v3_25031 [Cephalotus follicularis]|uniref:Uncharacterized protein n=1 Tax=Cephalotus follicularis TaxID=3775 RepID=A0A1Q3CMW2_CEPFO|nr:hypothetical protein CFOL_v3_25031 [Cephalotus follicularis]
MSSSSCKSDGENCFDVEELLQIGSRCRELRFEKDMLRESQSQSFDLIKRLELLMKSLSDAHTKDKKHIEKLEQELMNCSQEIDYLQDQLNARNTEVNYLGEHIRNVELELADMENLRERVGQLRDELSTSNSERLLLMQELEIKEDELQKSASCIEKLEESISSVALESQCEIESMRLDMISLEQSCFEAKKIREENIQERDRLDGLIEKFEVRFQDAEEVIECLVKENRELRKKLVTSEMSAKTFCQKIERWLEKNDGSEVNTLSLSELEITMSKEMREVFGPLISKLALLLAPDANLMEKMESMSLQIREYQVLVKQLQEELREEKLKAKEEAEDLAQEMAELRYQLTGLLEEEYKRRACIEQASLQRIAELEAQIQKQQIKPLAVVRHLREV